MDDDESTRWATDESAKSAWLEADLGKPVTFSRAVVVQAYPELKRIRKFAVEYCVDGQWTTCCTGENPGATFEATFAPVTGQRVRLNITESTGGPTIAEFQLFAK